MNIKSILVIVFMALIGCNEKQSLKTDNNKSIEKATSLIPHSMDELIGEFSLKPENKAEIKISKEFGKYYVELYKDGKWANKTELNNVKNEEAEELFGSNWREFYDYGLAKNGFAIFKVKKGYSTENRTFKTGYFLYYAIATDLYKK